LIFENGSVSSWQVQLRERKREAILPLFSERRREDDERMLRGLRR